jgi:hypothetical protein
VGVLVRIGAEVSIDAAFIYDYYGRVIFYLLVHGRVAGDGELYFINLQILLAGIILYETLEAIRRAGVEDVVVVTTRYFGGILLGAGGLTRAYAGVAHAALSAAGVAEYIPFTDYLLDCTYGDYQRILQEYPRFEGRERDCTFSERVQLTVGLPDGRAEEFCKRILDVSAGACVPRKLTTRLDINEA